MSYSRSDESGKLFRIRKTVSRMLLDRGYVVPEADLNMTKEQACRPACGLGTAPTGARRQVARMGRCAG